MSPRLSLLNSGVNVLYEEELTTTGWSEKNFTSIFGTEFFTRIFSFYGIPTTCFWNDEIYSNASEVKLP